MKERKARNENDDSDHKVATIKKRVKKREEALTITSSSFYC
jgi:hypothetical protein